MEWLRSRQVAEVLKQVGEVDLADLTRDEDVALRQPGRSRDHFTRDVRKDFWFAGRLRLVLQSEDRFGESGGEEEGLPRGGELVDDERELGRKGRR